MLRLVTALLLTAFSIGCLNAQPCTIRHNPVVFIHGMLGAGDNYAPMIRALVSAGYCPDRCHAFDWNSLSREGGGNSLDRFVDSIRNLHGVEKVDLVGHSAGGGLAYAYLSDSLQARKVGRYVHIGSRRSAAATPVPMLNIYSRGDRVVPGGDIPGAENREFETLDHFEVVTDEAVAAAVFAFLQRGQKPPTAAPHPIPDRFPVGGRIVTLGENQPQPGTRLLVYPVDPAGRRGNLLAELTTDGSGRFAWPDARPGQAYLMYCKPAQGRTVAYYLPELHPGEQWVYLRTLPSSGLAALLTASLPADNAQTAMVLFSNRKAVIYGRDSLTVNGLTLSTEALAPASKTAIAWFLYDANRNGMTDGNALLQFGAAPFMQGVDMRLQAGAQPINISYNGRQLRVPAVPAADAALVVVL